MASSGGGRQRVRSSRRRSARHSRPNKLTDTRSAYGRTSTDPSESQHIRILPEAEAKRGQTFAGVVAAAATNSGSGKSPETSNRAPPSPFFTTPIPPQPVSSSGKPTFADKLKTQLPVEVQTDRKDPRTFVKPKTGEKRQPQAQLPTVMETGENTKPFPMTKSSAAAPTSYSKIAAQQHQQLQNVHIATPRPRLQVAVPDSWEMLSQASSPQVLSPINDRRINQHRSQQVMSARHTAKPSLIHAPILNRVAEDFEIQPVSEAIQDSDDGLSERGENPEDGDENYDDLFDDDSEISVTLSAAQASEFLFGGEAGLEKLAKKNIPIRRGSRGLSVSSHVIGMVETQKGKHSMDFEHPGMELYARAPSNATPRPNSKLKPTGAEDYSETRSFWEEMNRWRDKSNRIQEQEMQRRQAATAGHPTEPRTRISMDHQQMQNQSMTQNPMTQHAMGNGYYQGQHEQAPYDPTAEDFFRLRHRNDVYTRLENLQLASMHPNTPVTMFTEHDRQQLFAYRNNPNHFGITIEGHGGFGPQWVNGVESVKADGNGVYFPHLLNFQDRRVAPPPAAPSMYPPQGFEYVPPGIGGRIGDPLHPDYIANMQMNVQLKGQTEAQRMGAPPPPPGFNYYHYGQGFGDFQRSVQRSRKLQSKAKVGHEARIPVNEHQFPQLKAGFQASNLEENSAMDAEDSSGEESSIHMDEDEMEKFTKNHTAGKLVFKQRHSQMARTHDAPVTQSPTRQPIGPKSGVLTAEEARKEWSARRGKGGNGRRL